MEVKTLEQYAIEKIKKQEAMIEQLTTRLVDAETNYATLLSILKRRMKLVRRDDTVWYSMSIWKKQDKVDFETLQSMTGVTGEDDS